MNATVGGTGKYVLKQNTSGKADVWKKFSLVWDTRKKGKSGADDEAIAFVRRGLRAGLFD